MMKKNKGTTMDSRVKDIGPVSRCLEDALEAALRGAFEVALEIAVKEVSRLAGQALRDVQDQIHETQQENITLKLRLQHICAEHDNPKLAVQPNQDSLSEDTPGKVCEKQESDKCDVTLNDANINNEKSSHERFYDVHTADIQEDNFDPGKKFKTHNTQHTDNIQHVESSGQDPSSLYEPVFEPVKVKHEEPEPERPVLDGSSECGFDAGPDYSFDQRSNEEFGLDRIALAQSKFLEDWRPDSEQQSETEQLDAGPSLGASEISLSSSGCVSSFSTINGLYQHEYKSSLTQPPQNCSEQLRTIPQSNLYVCKFCGNAFHSESDRHNHHIQYHKTVLKGKVVNATRPKRQRYPPGVSPYQCTLCNQRFTRPENLKTHLRIHTGERPYSCSVCGVRFRHAGVLTRHFRIHTGEKPYICSECGKSFRNCGGLRTHQISHSPGNSLRKSKVI